MAPDLTKSGSNTQNNRVLKNGPKYQLLTPDNLAFSIWEKTLDHVVFNVLLF